MCEYVAGCEPFKERHKVMGSATNVDYGLHECGDIFQVWIKDLIARPDMFLEV